MDSSGKSNKIRDIVRLQQLLKKWKKVAHNRSNATATATASGNGGNKSIKFLKKTLSFSESSSSSSLMASTAVPKGSIAVSVGKESKRFVIPTEYLSHQAFGILLREAEEEFGFQQEGVLKFPCEVDLFEKILKILENKKTPTETEEVSFLNDQFGLIHNDHKEFIIACGNDYSPDHSELNPSQFHIQMCR
ncbi:hypothetical protein ACJIZ3_010082 [Penstemon smallii]|uniref:SAUR family protein n=1 Tax=Penstemon smallii TaxID=265156 RepID=A0ABD3TFF2_9LAMI